MPWCPRCDLYRAPSAVRDDGTCAECGATVDPGGLARAGREGESDEDLPPVPWHLKLLAVALAIYLGFRFWQGIEWVLHRFG